MTTKPLAIFGQHQENTIIQMQDVASRAVRSALMADGHHGYVMPIGGVAAYRDQVSVIGVGVDIACGIAALKTNLRIEDIAGGLTLAEFQANPHRFRSNPQAQEFARAIDDVLSFGVGRKNTADDAPVDDPLFLDPAWWLVPNIGGFRETLLEKAQRQLGTLGSGNHFCDVLVDEAGVVWIMAHFGSRGFGFTIARNFLAIGQGGAWGDKGREIETLLDTTATSGQDYLALMTLAGRYAYAGREWVVRKVASVLGGAGVDLVHNHHNFCIPGGQIVQTEAGPKNMKDVRPGDILYAMDGHDGLVKTSVLRHWLSGTKETLSIRTRSRLLRLSHDHPVLTVQVVAKGGRGFNGRLRSQGSLVWKRAGAVRRGDIVVCATGFYDRNASVGIKTARLVGAFLGDGWIRHDSAAVSGYTVGFAIGGVDDGHTGKYKRLLESSLPRARWNSNTRGAFGLTCSSVAVWNKVVSLGLGLRSKEKRVPNYAFLLPEKEKLALLSGYFDADGSVAGPETSNHGRGYIASVSMELVQGLREIALGCGLSVSPIRSEHRVTNYGPCHVHMCSLSTDSMSRLTLWHAKKKSNVRRTVYRRDQGLAIEKIGYLALPAGCFAQRVWSIEHHIGAEEVYDLSVSHDSHSFLCEGVVVHNCWTEQVDGEDLHVVRKGATPAFPGQRGAIGGSMGDDAVIVEGAHAEPGSETRARQESALFSTVHGAGRVMSRTQAAGRRNRKTRKVLTPGEISGEMLETWLNRRGVILKGGGLDEAPQAYRRLPDVLEAQSDTVNVLHTLRPLIVVMAGDDIFDPFKD